MSPPTRPPATSPAPAVRRRRPSPWLLSLWGLLLLVGWWGGRALREPEARPEPETVVEEIRLPPAKGMEFPRRVEVAAKAAAPAEEPPRAELLPPPTFHPRPQEEWQGMLVDTSQQALCDVSARCGLAMACREGRCGPCERDAHCDAGEVCVLDHCVKQELASCRSRRDCREEEALCILSGLSPGARGNETMRSLCLGAQGGQPEQFEPPAPPPEPEQLPAHEPMPVPIESLMQELREQP
jgi:hypothetical protein